MPQRTYYVVLGVAADETQHGIRAAFRDLAKRYHPDRIGPGGTANFREIAEAYGVLADADSRRRYDEELQQGAPAPVFTEPDDARIVVRSSPEPLIPERISLRRHSPRTPSTDAMFARFERNFSGIGVPKAEQMEPLHLHVGISHRQAETGTVVELGVPVFLRCASCDGFGRTLLRQCPVCCGQGLVESERAIPFRIPPLTGSRATFVVPLHRQSIHNFHLVVDVTVEASR